MSFDVPLKVEQKATDLTPINIRNWFLHHLTLNPVQILAQISIEFFAIGGVAGAQPRQCVLVMIIDLKLCQHSFEHSGSVGLNFGRKGVECFNFENSPTKNKNKILQSTSRIFD